MPITKDSLKTALVARTSTRTCVTLLLRFKLLRVLVVCLVVIEVTCNLVTC